MKLHIFFSLESGFDFDTSEIFWTDIMVWCVQCKKDYLNTGVAREVL